jgi:predicted small lipoprotein YifL
MPMPRLIRLSLIALLAAGGLAACGKRGQLDPPPAAEPQQKAEPQSGAGEGSTSRTGRKRIPITAPKRELFIDGLLD